MKLLACLQAKATAASSAMSEECNALELKLRRLEAAWACKVSTIIILTYIRAQVLQV